MSMRYSEKTLEYYNNLKNIGVLDEKNEKVGTGIVGSPLCGDVMKLQLLFDDNDKILDVKYKVFGCVSAIASMEYIAEQLKGVSLDDAKLLKNSEVADSLELTKIKKHCSVLGEEAIQAAILDYETKKKNNGVSEMISVSQNAIAKLKELMDSYGEECIGVGIVIGSGGCSGVDYNLSYEMKSDSPNESSRKFYEKDGIKFFYDEEAELLVRGLEIDVVENSFGHGFVVTNKNQFSCANCTCKCG